jgi:catechol 2,3-dioxygenase-like lactoylglutathione lyase family enzyme
MIRPTTTAVSPCFIVNDVEETIAFYGKLGFETRFLAPEQGPFFAIIGRDGAQLFLKSERDIAPVPNHTRHPHLRWDAFLYTADPDALADEFTANNAPFSKLLQDTHDGLRGFEIRDLNGYILFFGRPITG